MKFHPSFRDYWKTLACLTLSSALTGFVGAQGAAGEQLLTEGSGVGHELGEQVLTEGTGVGNDPGEQELDEGTGTGHQPVTFIALAMKVSFTTVHQVERNGVAGILRSRLEARQLINLARGRAAGSPVPANEMIALALGGDLPQSLRLVVFDKNTARQLAIIAEIEKQAIVELGERKVLLLKLNFPASGNATNGVVGGQVQLIAETVWSHGVPRVIASGNGRLDFTVEGSARTAIISGTSLSVPGKAVGTFID